MPTQLFSRIEYPLSTLIGLIETGSLGLPELQRPFVWERVQVRDLLDSLYRGYPAGSFLFWKTTASHGSHSIGAEAKQVHPDTLIVDGQQRLTSLFAVIKGMPVIDKDFDELRIRIAFHPQTGRFEVANSATEKDPQWISSISDLWAPGANTYAFITEFIERLSQTTSVDADAKAQIATAIDDVHKLTGYTFTAIALDSSMSVDEVSQVFVRVNSKGVSLNQADFILTLMSVYWDEGRHELERFSRDAKLPSASGASPFNYILRPSPAELLRVAASLGLRRGQLRVVYRLLRGRDLDTDEASSETREKQFAKLKAAQGHVLDLTNWHEFLKAVRQAGYQSNDMVTSDNNILMSYLAFLVGRVDHNVAYPELRAAIAKWFFMSAATGRYTGNYESRIDQDLRRWGDATSGEDFLAMLDETIATNLTTDFWNLELPDALDTSSAYHPGLFAYHASLCLLGATALFSKLSVSSLLDPSLQAKKKATERHHLFPKAYLNSIGISDIYRVNQIANMALLEWPDNLAISDSPPSDYFPEMFEAQVDEPDREAARFLHALPDGWEDMAYADFLAERRPMIAAVVKAGYEKLASGLSPFATSGELAAPEGVLPTVAALISEMETSRVEFKGSARVSLDPDQPDVPEKAINGAVIKTVAAFMNTDGGTLGIGIADDGAVLGIGPDLKLKPHDIDGYMQWLVRLLSQSIGQAAATRVGIRFETVDDRTVCILDVKPSPKPVHATTDKGSDLFFVRMNNTTYDLKGAEMLDYVAAHWPLD